MGTVVNLTTASSQIAGVDLDSLVVRENYTATDGGVTLDMTGYPRPYLRAGHVIIRTGAVGSYVYKPMPITGTGASSVYGTLPADHTYYGHAVQSVLASQPFVGVTYHAKINRLVVNPTAGYFNLATILTALQTALTHVIYKGDKD